MGLGQTSSLGCVMAPLAVEGRAAQGPPWWPAAQAPALAADCAALFHIAAPPSSLLLLSAHAMQGPPEILVHATGEPVTGIITGSGIHTCGGAVMYVVAVTNQTGFLPAAPMPEPTAPASSPGLAAPAAGISILAPQTPPLPPPPPPATAPSGAASGCFPSLAAAVFGNPHLTLLQTVLNVSHFNLSDPSLNGTFFAPWDSAIQQILAQQGTPSGSQGLVIEAANRAQLLHTLVSYWLVPEDGLTLEHLRAMDGAFLPTLLEGRELQVQVQANATDPQAGLGGDGGGSAAAADGQLG